MTTLKLPKLHDGQRKIWESPARFKPIAAGRRYGKSRVGALKCISEAVMGKRWWWVWPSHSNGLIGWRILKHLGQQIPDAETRIVERMILFPNGGYAQMKSADKPDSLRGEGLDGVIVDEAAHIRKFQEVWQQSLRPALSDRKGAAWFISTPKGFNDFYELFKLGHNGNGSGIWESFQYSTWDNPYIDPDEIEAAKADLPDLIFRQEYGAEFVQLAGALFRREWINIVETAPEDIRYVRFWDLAVSTKTTADYTVGAKIGLMKDGTLVVADVVRGRWEWPDALKIIGNTARADGVKVQQGIEDVGVQKGMYQLLQREPTLVGLTFRPIRVTGDKITRASPWIARAEQGKFSLVRGNWNNAFTDEILAFPEVNHDDQIDAVSGAVQMVARTAIPFA